MEIPLTKFQSERVTSILSQRENALKQFNLLLDDLAMLVADANGVEVNPGASVSFENGCLIIHELKVVNE